MDNFFEAMGAVFTAILVVAAAIFLGALTSIFFGWLTGVIIVWVCGDWITSGLNLMFDTTRFTTSQIPTITATLALIGSFFKSSFTQKKDKE